MGALALLGLGMWQPSRVRHHALSYQEYYTSSTTMVFTGWLPHHALPTFFKIDHKLKSARQKLSTQDHTGRMNRMSKKLCGGARGLQRGVVRGGGFPEGG